MDNWHEILILLPPPPPVSLSRCAQFTWWNGHSLCGSHPLTGHLDSIVGTAELLLKYECEIAGDMKRVLFVLVLMSVPTYKITLYHNIYPKPEMLDDELYTANITNCPASRPLRTRTVWAHALYQSIIAQQGILRGFQFTSNGSSRSSAASLIIYPEFEWVGVLHVCVWPFK